MKSMGANWPWMATGLIVIGLLGAWALVGGQGDRGPTSTAFGDNVLRVEKLGDANAYLLVGETGLTLIDTGYPGKAGEVLAAVREAGHAASDVHTIVLTHGDPDHIGNAAALKAATGARIAIGEADAAALAGRAYVRAGGVMGVFFGVVRWALKPEAVEPDLLLRDGDTIAGLRVHGVPGHTPGSIAFSTDDGTLFSGDALLGDSNGRPKSPPRFGAWDGDQLDASRGVIEAMECRLVLPGHGEPIEADR